MSKGILQVHPPICDCPGCRISSPVNRGRLADKRTVTLSATRSLKKERTPSFSASDGDSDGSGPTCGRQPGLKREDGPHIHIMKRRVHTHWDLNISFRETASSLVLFCSSVHRSRHLVMPEHQSRCEFQRGSLEIGLGPAGDLLGKRLGHSSHISSDCSSEKRARSQSPQDLLRVRQEVAAAALRSPSGLETHLPPATAGQRRKQGLAQHREAAAPAAGPSFSERYWGGSPRACQALCSGLGLDLGKTFRGVTLPWAAVLRARLERVGEAEADLGDPAEERGAPSLGPRGHGSARELRAWGGGGVGSWRRIPRRAPRKGGPGSASARPGESKEMTGARLWAQDGSEDEPPKDSDGEDPETAAAGCQEPAPGQAPAGGAGAEGKGLFSGCTLPPSLPLGFPYAVSPYFHTGTVGGLSVDGEEAPAPEDVSKWTVDDVCSFVGGLSGCGEYTRVFREQGIDGETLPLLTEEHLLTTMGLKLGPALKIRAQVARRLGRVFYMASFPVALPLQPPTLRAPERELSTGEQPLSPRNATSPYGGGHASASHASPKQENGTLALLPGAPDPPQPLC
uniref:Sterile alpha motif domain containing 11 n=1 Tax=Saimiri boliviensis boliviensis TaxID=39432 RepID=A0A2K6V153_SAIBB